MARKKIALIGAGMIGGTLAHLAAMLLAQERDGAHVTSTRLAG
jgi:malate/lactate dehydrogenase